MSKQAIIYARVSTDEQAEKGYGLVSQLSACRKYAGSNNLEVSYEITDDFSGATLDRPGFSELLALLNEGMADVVVVYASDRLARNYVDAMVIRDQWHKAGIELHTVENGKSEFDFAGNVVDMIFALKADQERKDILERTSRGRWAKARRGKPVLSGIAPYGYRKVGKGPDAKLIFHPAEIEVVKDIYQWYLRGDGENGPLSLYAISEKLISCNVPTPSQRKGQRAKVWHTRTVRGILTNPIYAGYTFYGKIRQKDGVRTKRPRSEWQRIDVPELAVVDQKVFDSVQARAEKNKRLAKRNRKREYLLAGHIRCGTCGYSVIGYSHHQKGRIYGRYHCHSMSKKHLKCSTAYRSVICRKADNLIWKWLSKLISDDDLLNQGLRRMAQRAQKDLEPLQNRADTILELIGVANQKTARLVKELNDGGYEDDYLRSVFRQEIKDTAEEKKRLEAEHVRIEIELSHKEITAETEERIRQLAREVRKRLPNATYEEKRYFLDRLNVQVIFHADDERRWLEVSCALPASGDLIVLPPS